MEPITSAVTQYCILGTPLTPVAMASLPIIVGGAIAFSGNPLTDTSLSVGIGAAFASNIILAIRNLAIKKMDDDDKPVLTLNIRQSQLPLIASIMLGCSVLLLYLEKLKLLPPAAPYIIATCFLSGVFHVVYSYVSTGMVLTQLSVVSHAVANIMKRVLVVLLLYLGGTRQASLMNFLGLLVCVAGLILYAWDKRPREQKSNTESGNGAFFAISALHLWSYHLNDELLLKIKNKNNSQKEKWFQRHCIWKTSAPHALYCLPGPVRLRHGFLRRPDCCGVAELDQTNADFAKDRCDTKLELRAKLPKEAILEGS
ncbi:phosphoenolpyruvate/phosphate translocator 2, chloroplastic [Plakobranchus ocellatus]|uniref:Phosphoenolpyruvate/phosphate translocator 2, chloroplastic n=1 Tax=Plakobranchus ocellatus TaxID=259542 RepID=A0AAV3ZIF2_9GAST|nr:phosphoenolpyruvate/phosphate translocator 2, chloroplastic [Plakobranchus ocellatus]